MRDLFKKYFKILRNGEHVKKYGIFRTKSASRRMLDYLKKYDKDAKFEIVETKK